MNVYRAVQMFFKKSKTYFFRSSVLMENFSIGFFIDIWCSLHQSFSQRLLNFSFSGSSPCFCKLSEYGHFLRTDEPKRHGKNKNNNSKTIVYVISDCIAMHSISLYHPITESPFYKIPVFSFSPPDPTQF